MLIQVTIEVLITTQITTESKSNLLLNNKKVKRNAIYYQSTIKNKTHIINSVDEQYLKQLVINFENIKSNEKIIESPVVCDPHILSEIFLNLKIENLIQYFDDDGWLMVLIVYNEKINIFTCKICLNLCTKQSIECESCFN